jgi:hypothetical protein
LPALLYFIVSQEVSIAKANVVQPTPEQGLEALDRSEGPLAVDTLHGENL